MLSILLFPIRLVLGIAIVVLSILLAIGNLVLGLISGVLFIIAVVMMVLQLWPIAIPLAIFAFLISPLGLPRIASAALGVLKTMRRSLGGR